MDGTFDWNTIFGWNASGAGLAAVVIGLLAQIIKNWWRRNCDGLSILWIIFASYSQVSWLVYGISREDLYLCIPQVLGTFCMTAILVQAWIYRKAKQSGTKSRAGSRIACMVCYPSKLRIVSVSEDATSQVQSAV